ncbi:DUF1553 domain-containing protein [Stieleria marina]|uniref:Protein containing DUF1549 n=1 Tax=Stieleria marina TaxID=1930275 RepID=A0A517P0N2_9BACT|nr:hypothetical protein K239x_49470 [Planctomycetes bacterium K23_9]
MNPESSPSNQELSDNDVALLLREALDAPPVPPSLIKKIDRGIQREWGTTSSPSTVPAKRLAARDRLRRVWPAVAAIAGMLMLGFFVFGGSSSYAWATMLEAIARQPAFQIDDASSGEPMAHLSNDSESGRSESDSRHIPPFLRLILRKTSLDGKIAMDGLQVKDEGWRKSGDQILLTCAIENDSSQRFRMEFSLDPKTSLPKTVRLLDQDQSDAKRSRPLRVSYPSPESIAVARQSASLVAKATGRDASGGDAESGPSKAIDLANATDLADVTGKSPAAENPVRDTLSWGETPQWPSVSVVHRSDVEMGQAIDQTLAQLWQEQGIDPVPLAEDSELLRRVYLDIAGRTPTVTEARHYLEDADPDRYRELVQRLITSADHASHLATTLRTFLIPEGVDLEEFGGREEFDRWLAQRFEAGEAYDSIVRQLLLAEGRLSKSGPLLFYSAAKLDPDRLAAQTSRVFLGIRLECAQCHDHPFEPWLQEDFWSYAAFFARISRPQAELETVSSVMQVRDVDRGDVMLPETDMIVPPRFLGSDDNDENDESVDRRVRLANWLTSPKNPYFARATVNRLWSLMFGRGIVDPVDDFGSAHPPLSPELLDLLASQLIDSGFDLQNVMQTIALSRAYQLSSASPQGDSSAKGLQRLKHFAQMEVKTLTAPQLYDCITVATLLDQNAGVGGGFQLNRFGNSGRAAFLQQFASPASNRIEFNAGIPQALTLMNGGLIDSATGVDSSGLLKSLDAPFFSNDERMEVLFLATLSRKPTGSEWNLLRSAIPENAPVNIRSEVLSDMLWALINSAEFSLNH